MKRNGGKGNQGKITIHHIGIIKGIVLDANYIICSVDWVATNLGRLVDCKDALKSVHGPYEPEVNHAKWLQEIFCL